MSLPPLPPGFVLERGGSSGSRPSRGVDPWQAAQSAGFNVTNGYRTQQDQQRIRRQGYRPAPNSDHLRGDAMDLTHPSWSRQQMISWARNQFEDWPGAQFRYHDGHLHVGLPGWQAAPGTPGTRNSGLPAVPAGFELEQRGSLAGGNFVPARAPAQGTSEVPAPPQAPAPNTAPVSVALPPQRNAVDGTILEGQSIDAGRRAAMERFVADLMGGVPDDQILARLQAAGVSPTETSGNVLSLLGERRQLGLDRFRAENPAGFNIDPGAYTAAPQPLPNRIAASAARGLADLVGMPVDVINGALRMVGVPVSDEPFMGSEWIRGNWNVPGQAVVDLATGGQGMPAPRIDDISTSAQGPVEDFAQRTAYFLGGGALPAGGLVAQGARTVGRMGLQAATAPVAGQGGVVAQAGRQMAVGAARNPAATARGEVLAALGAAGGGQAAATAFPGNPLAEGFGAVVGGMGGAALGFGRGGAGRRDASTQVGRITTGPESPAQVQAQLARMDKEAPSGPEVVAPSARPVDRIDIDQLPPIPPGFRPLEDLLGNPPVPGERPTPLELAGIARSIPPEDVLPMPSNRVRSLDEHIQASADRFRDVEAPNELAELQMRRLPSFRGEEVSFRGPLDAESFLRQRGGLRDSGGELRHLGITNNRPRYEATGEERLGPILNKQGMTLDEAGEALWEGGYFPDLPGRPSVDDVLDVLRASRSGQRTFRPDDMDEMSRFYDAQAQRYAVQAAEQEGAPLTEDIGTPVSVDDAPTPPATAYEDLPEVIRRVGNINLGAIESAEDIGRLLQNVEARFGGFDAARRGRLSFGEIERLAGELGMTADDLLRRRPGQALNAEQALAARAILSRSSDEVIELARRLPRGSDADRTMFSQALLRHAAIHEQVTGAISEAGRSLSSMRAAAKSRAVAGRIHQITADAMGGQQRLEDIAERIVDLQRQGVGPGQLNQFAVNSINPRFSDKLQELWYNSLLSGPQTHAVNVLSNLMTGVLQFPEQAVASGLGQVRRVARSARGLPDDFDRITASELGPRLIGYSQGTREGLRAAARTLRTGEVSDYVTKVESRVQEAIPGRLGQVVRVPSRLLASEDEFFKAVARRMELSALVARRARSEGLSGAAYKARVRDLTANPPDDLLERSMDYARYLTFQRPLGSIGQRISATTQEHPWLKLFVPFVRTPTNILKYAVERSPAASLLREVRADLRARGERRALAVARMALGTGLGITITQMVAEGKITGGGPAARGAEDLLRADGWQPYSFRVGDRFYSYQRLDPLAMTLGVAADLADYSSHMTERQSEEAGALLIVSIMRNLQNKTWLSGMSDVLSAIDDPERSLPSLIGRLAGSLAVPTGVAQAARYVDPVQRETRSSSIGPSGSRYLDRALGSIQNRVPGLSASLEPRRDAFGREIVGEGGLGPDLASPIWTRTARNDPIIRHLLDNMINVGRPARFLRVDGRRRELSTEEYGRYQQLSGQYIYRDLQEALSDPDWPTATPAERRRWVEGIKRDARADARADLAFDTPPLPTGFHLAR